MTEEDKPPKDVITIEEVCALLGPPRRTIYQLAYTDPEFPKPFKPGKRLFWIRTEILEYRKKKQAEFATRHDPTSPASREWERQAAASREYARRRRRAARLKSKK